MSASPRVVPGSGPVSLAQAVRDLFAARAAIFNTVGEPQRMAFYRWSNMLLRCRDQETREYLFVLRAMGLDYLRRVPRAQQYAVSTRLSRLG